MNAEASTTNERILTIERITTSFDILHSSFHKPIFFRSASSALIHGPMKFPLS